MSEIVVRKCSQWDKASVDSGFCSDAERQKHLKNRHHKTKSVHNDAVTGSEINESVSQELKTEMKSSKSLPLFYRAIKTNDSVDWNEVTLKDFDHVRYLGGGGYARVDLIKWNRKERKDFFAMKKINKKLFVEPKQIRQYEAEIEVLQLARSRFIPRLFKTFCSPNHVYLLTEACLGGDLFSYLERSGPVQVNVARFIVACVIEALDYLHRVLRVIHRDVKTENLLVGDRGILKLADLGFCKRMETGISQTHTFCGTPGYIAPELILHRGHSYSVDYFSLGVVTYETLTCRSPFRRHAVLDTYKATLRGITEVVFPNQLDHSTCSFVRALCYREPERRLGSEASSHDWFYGFDWDLLRSGEMISPLSICNDTWKNEGTHV